jgi:hypothetical protein
MVMRDDVEKVIQKLRKKVSPDSLTPRQDEPIHLNITTQLQLGINGSCPRCGHTLSLTPHVEMVKSWGYPAKKLLRWRENKKEQQEAQKPKYEIQNEGELEL